jgi:hypothetical protein
MLVLPTLLHLLLDMELLVSSLFHQGAFFSHIKYYSWGLSCMCNFTHFVVGERDASVAALAQCAWQSNLIG